MESVKNAAADAEKKAVSLFEEFKSFAFKGNVVDLAIGVVIGATFGKLIDSLVKHVLMPLLGLLLPGEQGYLGWNWVVGGKEVPYGLFLGELVYSDNCLSPPTDNYLSPVNG